METTQPNIQDEKTQDAVAEVAQPAIPDEVAVAQPAIPDEGVVKVAQPVIDDFSVVPGVAEMAPYEQLQDARAKLNSALGSIDGSDLAISKAEDQVILLEYEMETAQANVAVARQDALGFRQSLHDACDETQSAIRLIRAKYPLA